jgi:hypothetical protein
MAYRSPPAQTHCTGPGQGIDDVGPGGARRHLGENLGFALCKATARAAPAATGIMCTKTPPSAARTRERRTKRAVSAVDGRVAGGRSAAPATRWLAVDQACRKRVFHGTMLSVERTVRERRLRVAHTESARASSTEVLPQQGDPVALAHGCAAYSKAHRSGTEHGRRRQRAPPRPSPEAPLPLE